MASELDLEQRDPNNLNDVLRVQFDDVFGEPEGAHSIDCVWKLSYSCFNCWKNFCYKLCTLLCGICIAACWGCQFASIVFQHVWMVTPMFRVLDIQCACIKRLYGLIIQCCLDPLCESCGLLFRAFKKDDSDMPGMSTKQ